MKRNISSSYILSTLFALLILSGCGAKDVVKGERDAEAWVDDKAIMLSIEKEFLTDDIIRFVDFNAYSYDGHVYIVGLYTDREQVDRAVKIAKSFDGVRKVSTYFVPKGQGRQCSGAQRLELGTEVRHALVTDETIWASDITVEVLQCNIILLGIVDNEQQKAAAEAHAKGILGVDRMKSFLRVRY